MTMCCVTSAPVAVLVVVWERPLRGRKGLAQTRSLLLEDWREHGSRCRVRRNLGPPASLSTAQVDGQAISPPSTGRNTNNHNGTTGRTVQVLHRVRRTPLARQHVLQLETAHSAPRQGGIAKGSHDAPCMYKPCMEDVSDDESEDEYEDTRHGLCGRRRRRRRQRRRRRLTHPY